MEQITVTMSETALEKIKTAKAVFELISNLDNASNCIDSIQLLCNAGFAEVQQGMKNESKIALWSFMLAMLSFGCNSSQAEYTPATILEHQRKIDELEATLTRIDDLMSNTANGLREITDRSATMEAEIDGIIREFDDYQQRVEQLLREYNALRNPNKNTVENCGNASVDSGSFVRD